MDGLNLSTPIQVLIVHVQECDRICPPLSNKPSPLSKSATKFVHPYPSSDRLCPQVRPNFVRPH
jgi:hypothetical protein